MYIKFNFVAGNKNAPKERYYKIKNFFAILHIFSNVMYILLLPIMTYFKSDKILNLRRIVFILGPYGKTEFSEKL